METKYVIENHQIKKQIRIAESLLDRTFTDFEKQVFEWAYIQGKEDFKEGYVK